MLETTISHARNSELDSRAASPVSSRATGQLAARAQHLRDQPPTRDSQELGARDRRDPGAAGLRSAEAGLVELPSGAQGLRPGTRDDEEPFDSRGGPASSSG